MAKSLIEMAKKYKAVLESLKNEDYSFVSLNIKNRRFATIEFVRSLGRFL
jgi:hypothetical protein